MKRSGVVYKITERNRSANRCPRCGINQYLCYCSLIPELALNTQLLVIMHWREQFLTSNSAGLAHLCLPHSKIIFRGLKDKTTPVSEHLLPDHSPIFLFPSPEAQVLSAEALVCLRKPIQIVVPDGTWRQASKMGKRERGLSGVPHFKLPPGPPSQYRLRHSPHVQNLSTFEAIARALGIIEGLEVQSKLEKIFTIMVERTLWSRGLLKASDCTTGIPFQAIEASWIAGARSQKRT